MPVILLTTCPDRATADRLAESLVERRLAACVNIMPAGRSVYIWKGKVESAEEHLLVIKASRRNFRGIREHLRASHPYSLPELIAMPVVAGLPEYLAWIENPDRS